MDQVTLAKNQVRVESWRNLIKDCQQSGQTVVNWCQANNINTKTYYYWLRKLRKAELKEINLSVMVPDSKPVAFKKLDIQTPMPADTQICANP